MKYKVGDKVTIKSREWYEKNKDGSGDINCGENFFMKDMAQYTGRNAVVTMVYNHCYDIDIDNGRWSWTGEMFEDNDGQDKSSLDTLSQLRSDKEQLEKNMSELFGDFIEKYKEVFSGIEIRKTESEIKINITL